VEAEGRIKVDAKPVQGAEGQFKSEAGIRIARQLNRLKSVVRRVRLGWISAAIAAGVLTKAYLDVNNFNIPVWWRGLLAAHRDPGSIKPGSGLSFIDRLADGQPCPQCPEMVVVPAGKFTMGSPEKEKVSDGQTQIPVTIARPFAVGTFAVTFDQWDACVADGGCNGYRPYDQGWGRGNRPVINVSWNDANTYAKWLSRKTGKTYRLLSEAEREYVTRAGTTTPFWWGTESNDTLDECGSGDRTCEVNTGKENPWGLFHVHDNVSEWTEDCWNASNQGNPGDGSARTTGDCTRRVFRGDESAYRGRDTIDTRSDTVGFRLARTLNP
jgi:formylglycine-generating enzyme required for sulfatase activity